MPSLLLVSKRGDQIIYGLIGGLVFGLIFGLSYDHTTAALLFDEVEAREKDTLRYLMQHQIRLEMCSYLF
jgi:hypothetical protein